MTHGEEKYPTLFFSLSCCSSSLFNFWMWSRSSNVTLPLWFPSHTAGLWSCSVRVSTSTSKYAICKRAHAPFLLVRSCGSQAVLRYAQMWFKYNELNGWAQTRAWQVSCCLVWLRSSSLRWASWESLSCSICSRCTRRCSNSSRSWTSDACRLCTSVTCF